MSRIAALPIFRIVAASGLLLIGGCSERQSGPVVVSVIGQPREFVEPLRYSATPASKLLLEATAQGLVAFNATGEIVPALAQRWIVQDDGRSYIFRLRRARWPDDSPIDAKEVAALLEARIRAMLDVDRLGDLEAVEQVVPMTGEVIEIRLSSPRPNLLQMLAQPQMAITRPGGGTGPYRRERRNDAIFLTPVSSANTQQGQDIPAWQHRVLYAERAAKAIVRFRNGMSSLVLGGRFNNLILVNKAGIGNDAIRMDPVEGLFGLAIVGKGPLLDDIAVREAMAMAMDRDRLPQYFGLAGWTVTNRLIPRQLDMPRLPSQPGWASVPIEERRRLAASAVAKWRGSTEERMPVLRIALPEGAGAKMLFTLIGSDLRRIGIDSRQVPMDADADLRLIDEVASYDSALWYLGRISCARKVRCSAAAEKALREASLAASPEQRGAKLAEAEALALQHWGYIPLANPLRWSLAARPLNGFSPSPRARHPLNHLIRATN